MTDGKTVHMESKTLHVRLQNAVVELRIEAVQRIGLRTIANPKEQE